MKIVFALADLLKEQASEENGLFDIAQTIFQAWNVDRIVKVRRCLIAYMNRKQSEYTEKLKLTIRCWHLRSQLAAKLIESNTTKNQSHLVPKSEDTSLVADPRLEAVY